LIQTAQGPLTRQLAPYFKIAERVSASFGNAEALDIHAAGAKLAATCDRSFATGRVSPVCLSTILA
jgi:hypothetical protein